MSKSVKKIVGKVAPLAGLIPGVGAPAAIALGAGGGLLSGGGIKGALMGGLGAGALHPTLGGSLGAALGASGATGSAIGSGLLGAGAGAAGGGIKGAAIGGLGGALAGYGKGGGFNGTALEGVLGTPAGTPLGGGAAGVGPTQGSGMLGAATNLKGDGFGALTRYAAPASAILSGVQGMQAQEDIEDQLLEAQGRSEKVLNPFLDAKFEPGDLTKDPGYQFALEQGNQSLDRAASARGGVFSGASLRAAQEFGQGLADQTYSDAYRRWAQTQGLNLNAAGQLSDVYGNQGAVKANKTQAQSNTFGKMLSSLSGGGNVIGYDSNGQPIYAGAA